MRIVGEFNILSKVLGFFYFLILYRKEMLRLIKVLKSEKFHAEYF